MRTSQKECPECGGSMVYRGYKHVQRVGKVSVTDGTGMAWQCAACAEPELSVESLAGYERRAVALVLRDGTHVDGGVVRQARKALGLRQADLAWHLGCAAETVSRWENGSTEIKRAEQLALVALLDGVEHGAMNEEELRQAPLRDVSAPLEVRPLLKRSA